LKELSCPSRRSVLRKAIIIFQRDFRELWKTRSFLVLCAISAFITIATVLSMALIITNIAWLLEEEARPLLMLIISLTAYFLPLFIILAFIWAFSSLPVIKEKANGNITSLLVTPLSPKEIWIGKSLAIFLPGYVISVVSIFIILIVVNVIIAVHTTGEFLFSAPLLLTGLIVNPLLFLGLLLFIILFSLANNPDIAIAPSFILGFGLMLGIPLGVATGYIDLASWTFFYWYLGGTVIVLIAVFLFSRILKNENIVLSSTGS
jgi:ABC-2 type transport system permease protein